MELPLQPPAELLTSAYIQGVSILVLMELPLQLAESMMRLHQAG